MTTVEAHGAQRVPRVFEILVLATKNLENGKSIMWHSYHFPVKISNILLVPYYAVRKCYIILPIFFLSK